MKTLNGLLIISLVIVAIYNCIELHQMITHTLTNKRTSTVVSNHDTIMKGMIDNLNSIVENNILKANELNFTTAQITYVYVLYISTIRDYFKTFGSIDYVAVNGTMKA